MHKIEQMDRCPFGHTENECTCILRVGYWRSFPLSDPKVLWITCPKCKGAQLECVRCNDRGLIPTRARQ